MPTTIRALTVTLLLVSGCGARQEPLPDAPPPPELVMSQFLLVYGRSKVPLLQEPDRDAEAIEAAISAAEGDATRPLHIELARVKLLAAEGEEDEEEASGLFRQAVKLAQKAARRSEDPEIARDSAFIKAWASWRRGARRAGSTVDRFIDDHGDAEQLVRLAWAIRGEMAYEEGEWDQAMSAFRELVGTADDPLYVLSQYRAGQCMTRLGQGRRARQALREVRNLACESGTSEEIRYLAALAAVELGTRLVRGPGGRAVPETCLDTGDE